MVAFSAAQAACLQQGFWGSKLGPCGPALPRSSPDAACKFADPTSTLLPNITMHSGKHLVEKTLPRLVLSALCSFP